MNAWHTARHSLNGSWLIFRLLSGGVGGKILRGVHLSRIKGMDHLSAKQVRPFLDVRKVDLVKYLHNRGFTWIEDSSNASPKYKVTGALISAFGACIRCPKVYNYGQRNRVRNELIPLAAELAGGQDALWKRFTELVEQSKQLSEWMGEYSVNVNQTAKPPLYFELNDDFQRLPEMVRASALHDWVTR